MYKQADDNSVWLHIGDPYEGTSTERWDHKRPIITGALSGLGTGTLGYLLSGLGKKGRKRSKAKRLLVAALTGAAGGGIGYGADYAWQFASGVDWGHKQKPDKKEYEYAKESGKTPRIMVYCHGGNGAPFHDYVRDYMGPRLGKKYGFDYDDKNIAVFAPEDISGMKQFIKRVKETAPDTEFTVYGYSLGGGGAKDFAHLAARQGLTVDKLVTWDPIYRFSQGIGKPKTTRTWDNYYPDRNTWRNAGDLGAIIAGVHRKGIAGANNHLVTGEFGKHWGIQEGPEWDEPGFNAPLPAGTPHPADDPTRFWTYAKGEVVDAAKFSNLGKFGGTLRKVLQQYRDIKAKLGELF